MRRSLLFIPSNNPAMLQNADVFGSDSVIFDLEDAVNVTEKDNARNLLFYYLQEHSNLNMEVVVRINGLDTEYYKDDLEKVISTKIGKKVSVVLHDFEECGCKLMHHHLQLLNLLLFMKMVGE